MEPTFAGHLKTHRIIKGLSQIELGERSQVDNSSISRIEFGARVPRRNTVDLLCQALELTKQEWDVMLDLAGYRATAINSLMNVPTLGLLDDIYPRLGEEDKKAFDLWLLDGLETWRGKL